jgi:hypothetical protein
LGDACCRKTRICIHPSQKPLALVGSMTKQQASFKSFLNWVAGGQHTGGDGQIEAGSFLLHVRRGQIDGGAA